MLFFLIVATFGHRCIFNDINKQTKKGVLPNIKTENEETSDWHPLRFTFDTIALTNKAYMVEPICEYSGQSILLRGSKIYNCAEADVLTTEKIQYIERLFKSLNFTITKMFNVHTIGYNKELQSGKICGESTFPQGYTIPEESDFHIMITSHPHTSAGVFAYAASCYYSLDTIQQKKRSVMGYVNIVTSALEPTEEKFRDQVGVIFHETMHALGFDGNIGVTKTVGKLNLKVIEDEVVVEKARKHFGCPNMTYVPLEDGGGSGTANCHWERRLFMSEIMNGITSVNARVSEMTLAYFEALGVYKPNYEMADSLSWGRNAGCSFFEDCSQWPKSNGYYCRTGIRRCTNDRSSIGVCDGNSFKEELNESYQHYGSKYIGGGDEIADNCIFIAGLSSSHCYQRISPLSLDYYIGMEMLNHGQNFGDNSMCFDSSLVKFIPFGIQNCHCYGVSCLNNSFYKVSIDGRFYDCDQTLTVSGYGGKLICVDPKDICGKEVIDYWPEIDSVDTKEVSVGNNLSINGRNLNEVNNVYIDNTPCEILSKTKEQITIKVDYRDPFFFSSKFKPSLMVEINSSINSCYDGLITIKVPFHYLFLNFADWAIENYIFIAVIPVWIIFFVLFFGYYILSKVFLRQVEEVHQVKKEINVRLNRKEKLLKKKACCCVIS